MTEPKPSYTATLPVQIEPQPVYSRQWRRTVSRLQELQQAGADRVIIEFSKVEWVITPLADERAIGIKP